LENDFLLLNTFGQRIDFLLKGITNSEVEKKTGISNELISLWRRGKGNPSLDKLELLRKYFKDKYVWLITGVDIPDEQISDTDIKYAATKFKSVPIVGSVPCGVPVTSWDIDDNKLLKLADVSHLENPFVLIAKGDSMTPYINNKDLLLCSDEPEKVKKNGKAVVVSFNSDPGSFNANAKLIKWDNKNKEIMLYSINTKYEPEIYPLKEVYKIYKVIRIIRDVN